MFFSPFEQFEIQVLLPLTFLTKDVSITNMTVYLFLTVGLILMATHLATRRTKVVPTRWQSLFELIYTFV